MKLWIDDVRPAPEGYKWCKSVTAAKIIIENCEKAVSDAQYCIDDFYTNYQNAPNNESYEKYVIPKLHQNIKINIIELIDIDHDAGEYAQFGGDYIKLLDWLEETGHNYPIHIHSMNPVGVENMRRIIQRNGWKEV